jgi:aryl-alcohol dehydrogenase-like predicted oxidoreductase
MLILGCGNFGGIGSAPELFGKGEALKEAFEIMDAAWEAGIRWFDTADAYGGGRSESFVAAWIAGTGNIPRLTTKTFNPMESGADSGLSRGRILRQIETSLRRLGVERVDLYLAHEFDPGVPLRETMDTFEELVELGVVGAYGVSNFSAEQLAGALEAGRPRVIQNSYSLLERGDEADVLPLCAENGIEYQAFSPLAGGWLTGKYRRSERYPEGSRMTLRPEAYRDFEDERVFAGLDRLRERGDPATLALAWALSQPTISAVVVGPRRPEHLEPVLAALALDLSPDEREEIASLFV